jgi:hypothetical protein
MTMVTKRHEAIAFYLLIASILALVIVSITFRYYVPEETFLFEDDFDINTGESVSYNNTLFDVSQHIYKITVSNLTAKIDPLLEPSMRVIINENFTDSVKGPDGYMIYNEAFEGEIEELILTDAGLSITFHAVFSALRDRNPVYISLSTVSCVLALYYFYVTVNVKKANKKTISEEMEKSSEQT